MYSVHQKRSECWPHGYSVVLAIVLQVERHSGEMQIRQSSNTENYSSVVYYLC